MQVAKQHGVRRLGSLCGRRKSNMARLATVARSWHCTRHGVRRQPRHGINSPWVALLLAHAFFLHQWSKLRGGARVQSQLRSCTSERMQSMFTRRIVRCVQWKSLTVISFLAVSQCSSRNHLRVFLGQRQAKIPTAIGWNRRQAMIIDAFAFGSRVTYPKPCSKQHSQDSSRRGEFWQSFRYIYGTAAQGWFALREHLLCGILASMIFPPSPAERHPRQATGVHAGI